MCDDIAKPVRWIASARTDLKGFPTDVRVDLGYALWLAQRGQQSPHAKPLKGIVVGGGVLEVVEHHDGNAYRLVYTVRFRDVVYVLHAFQKKSRRGATTPGHDIALLRRRYRAAAAHYRTCGGP
ncbi:MAG: addiction module toxin RelE [Gemmatimonadetes bacterium]|nr:addiction module toxin RelE [Gemmatimonadota bacterium]